jgi:choline dehydrogenase-like flavoprotein
VSGVVSLEDVAGRRRVRDHADVVVVGSGASGAVAARVLAGAGLDVVLVEEGPEYPQGARRADAWTSFARSWRDLSLQVAKGKAFTPILQGRAVGGTTAVNGAIIHRMPESVHADWKAEHGVGDVLSWSGLNRAWDELDEELSVAPTAREALGGNNLSFERGCQALGWEAAPTKRAVADCKATARCNQGCPTGQKRSMEVTCIPRAIADGARVYATCRAERIVIRRGRAVGIEGRFRQPVSGQRGPSLSVRARKGVVLAMGAVHTPLMLLKHGIGDPSLVGHRFACHPGTSVLPLFDEPIRFWHGATQGYECTEFVSERMKFEVVGLPPSVAVSRLPGYGRTLVERLGSIERLAHWGVQIRSEAFGRVRPGFGGGAAIRWDMTPADVARLKIGVRRLVEMAFAAGAKRVLLGVAGLPEIIEEPRQLDPLFDLPDDPRLFHYICAHLFGTAKIGADPRSGVVRETGETWDLPGLYAVDASVFPTNLGVNPQHTISAIAWLMAERIAAG